MSKEPEHNDEYQKFAREMAEYDPNKEEPKTCRVCGVPITNGSTCDEHAGGCGI